MAARPTPFDLVFAPLAGEHFPAIREALGVAGQDPRDRDAFLMVREVAILVRELRPEAGLGEGIDQLAALLHHAYLFWSSGARVVAIGPDRFRELLDPAPPTPVEPEAEAEAALYVQVPPRRLWARPVEGESYEPLDGCFLDRTTDGRLRVLAVFGFRPERLGFTVVEAQGSRPRGLVRPDGSALFAPTLEGGAQAGLHTLIGTEELLELGWRLLEAALSEAAEAGGRS
jgi:hypothetical protein